MQPKIIVHLVSLFVATIALVLAIGDKITSIGLQEKLMTAWPVFFYLAIVIDLVGSALVDFSQPKK